MKAEIVFNRNSAPRILLSAFTQEERDYLKGTDELRNVRQTFDEDGALIDVAFDMVAVTEVE